LLFIFYSENYESLREKKFDIMNINLSDYSVQMKISKEMKAWYKNYKIKNPNSD